MEVRKVESDFDKIINGVRYPLQNGSGDLILVANGRDDYRNAKSNIRDFQVYLDGKNMEQADVKQGREFIGITEPRLYSEEFPETVYIDNQRSIQMYYQDKYPGTIISQEQAGPILTAFKDAFPTKTFFHPLQIRVQLALRFSDQSYTNLGVIEVPGWFVIDESLKNLETSVKTLLIEVAQTGHGLTNLDRDRVTKFDLNLLLNSDCVGLAIANQSRNDTLSDSGLRWRSSHAVNEITRRAKKLALHFIQTFILV